jgi:hypothetical protein
MNQKMSVLLKQADISVPFPDSTTLETFPLPVLLEVGEFVLLRSHYEANKHVNPKDLPDKTAFECLINHVHHPFERTNASLRSCLSYAIALQNSLSRIANGRGFLVIASFDDHECVTRFHQVRQNENWVAADLEGYTKEAVLLLAVGEIGARRNVF